MPPHAIGRVLHLWRWFSRSRAQPRADLMRAFFLAIVACFFVLAPPPLLAARDAVAIGAGQTDEGRDADQPDSDKLEMVRAAPVSLGQAITIAEKLHPGTKSVRIEADIVSNALVYRVRTARDGQVWVSVVSGNSGAVVGVPSDSSPVRAAADEQRELALLQSIGPGLSDAVAVAERSTRGRAVLGELVVEQGRLKFAVVVLAGDALKEVVLEPPGARLRRPPTARPGAAPERTAVPSRKQPS
ncbi:PepSY domain-containing protein [Rhodopseudomonas sp. BR0M22]|uniref:PepSY domain-containing protein n=1 Tax=Rhodopseudomonas sp. BR0M22 TaxID=2269369 RepID=UPI001FED97EC|nr:PepSY domain-containing protein [Rhodopseudomonas sp. BR0M22]